MSKVRKRTFSVTAGQSDFIDRLVSRGGHASGSEVIREGLRMLQDRETEIERWLQREVAPTYDRWKAGLEETYSADEVFDELHRVIDEIETKKDSAGRKAAE
ncbi:type II toxin-antitoxin system ParD family antitoxin [Devosia sp.]|uniref:ribbon-helix-helix domain-containing protein n=1 Tax=Devosia sp. TaxID=1871048 RepID=UPI0032671A7E